MKVLFTGASSFTGLWFVRALASAGHEVVGVFRRRAEDYQDETRRRRVALALRHCTGAFGCSFGDEGFLDLAAGARWDLFCHHAAEVSGYKSPDFDALAALRSNTHNLAAVLAALRAGGGAPAVLLSGSIFENDEGAGSEGLPAFSPYGLSKGLTYQVFRYYAARAGLALGKFVIPNPFGPYEDAGRFTAYLARTWLAGGSASVATPAYVRDNVHVSLLALEYARFAAALAAGGGSRVLRPSGYVESQGAFARRCAREMQGRLGVPCRLELRAQAEFPEPRVRINTDWIDARALGWDEAAAWDELARFHQGGLHD